MGGGSFWYYELPLLSTKQSAFCRPNTDKLDFLSTVHAQL